MFSLTFSFFILGLIIGSFLNVLVYRLKDVETLLGRSFCRSCRHQIRWYDNIPLLSFVLLKGECRDCKSGISWQYPFLEILTAGLFAFAGAYFFSPRDVSSWLETAWLLGIIACFVVIAAYDLRYMEIPIILLFVSLGLTLLFFTLQFHSGQALWSSRIGLGLFGGAAVSLFFFALVFMSKETWMGWGDVWLGFVCGMIVGLPLALFMLTLSFTLGAFVGVAGIFLKGKSLKSQVPFAPFLVVGTLSTVFLQHIFPEFIRFFLL
ncbi:MAG: prepilin peptidase [Candidatus Moranbacteria bacterium]|nr:prepilin peptidase [Candidatus Moranbacteria bacterium]